MSKILLLGATGLIGSSVYHWLEKTQHVTRLGRSSECELKGDLSKPESMDSLVLDDFDVLVHCAGVTDEDFRSRPADAFIQSTLGLNALVQKAIAARVKRFIYISTSHVYGRQVGTIDESSASNPLSDYAIAHYAAEQTLKRNSSSFERVFVLRPNAVFGEPLFIDKFDRWSLIPYSFPLEAVYTQKIVLRSSGEQNRNFISTYDIARYVEGLIATNEGKTFEVINALGKDTMSVYEFGLKCCEIYRKVTGNECIVERPELKPQSEEEEFYYESNFNFSIEKDDIEIATTRLINTIAREHKNGKTYSA
jgi:UDP-glucose 4-epimerase